ncbi:hypothetical protein BGW41_002817 [Actinomortierella wolfii]|nr:hypothetical protein BGW41_002817 [Actinomortierella wolfii]
MDNAISPAAVRKVTRELYAILDDPPEGIRLILNEDSITDIQAWILGPEGTPYEGGCFRIRIQLSPDFPNSPPKCYFLTKIFHPNVSPQGDVCVNTLKKDWKKELGIRHILLVVKCLLIVPNPESALNEEAGRQLLVRYEDYAKHARIMTEIHAQAPRKEIFPAVQPSSAVSDGKAESEKTDAASVVPMAVDSPKVEIQNEDNRKTPSASDTANEGSSEKHQHSVVSAKSTTLTTTMAPSSSSPSTSALLTNSSVPSMASPTLESSSTLSRLNNSCIPCPMRSHKKRKLSTDEQQQHPSQSTLSKKDDEEKSQD